jgi:hypothetical protein
LNNFVIENSTKILKKTLSEIGAQSWYHCKVLDELDFIKVVFYVIFQTYGVKCMDFE